MNLYYSLTPGVGMTQLNPRWSPYIEYADDHESVDLARAIKKSVIDWDYFIALREHIIDHVDAVPHYLVLPEVLNVLTYTKTVQHHLFFSTLWNTGMRLAEALALTKGDFNLDAGIVSVKTLKMGQSKKKRAPKRLVPIPDTQYRQELQRYFNSQSLGKRDLLFEVSVRTPQRWLNAALDALSIAQPELKERIAIIHVTPKTFRHSYGVNAILHFIPLRSLRDWMGHQRIESTMVYTQLFVGDTMHLANRIQFS